MLSNSHRAASSPSSRPSDFDQPDFRFVEAIADLGRFPGRFSAPRSMDWNGSGTAEGRNELSPDHSELRVI